MSDQLTPGANDGTQVLPAKKLSVLGSSGLVSILVPCCGMLEYTMLCVPSVLKHSRAPYELIFLDIGSLDGTAAYLNGIKAASHVRVEIVRTRADIGIADACQEAVSAVRGQYLVLLNNDTVVTEGWLNKLIELVNLSPGIGMVGPMSNYAGEPQLVEAVPYRVKPKRGKLASRFGVDEMLLDVEAMNVFAREFREKNKTKWMEAERLGGFCLLLKRDALNRIGVVDLGQSELGLFETEALCVKMRQSGFTLACCRDLFIHHFGTRTFSHGAPDNERKATGDRKS